MEGEEKQIRIKEEEGKKRCKERGTKRKGKEKGEEGERGIIMMMVREGTEERVSD